MVEINLRDFYSHYTHDHIIEVPKEVADLLKAGRRQERCQKRRKYKNKAHYSLDLGDGIEREAVLTVMPPHEVLERKMTHEQVYAALASLPIVQRRRVYAHYILGVSKAVIARREGVREGAVRDSIIRGLKNMEKFFLENCKR